MSGVEKNFIADFDNLHEEQVTLIKNQFGKDSVDKKSYYVFLDLKIKFGDDMVENFLIRKERRKTRFLLMQGGTKIYLSDKDILEILINNKNIIGEQKFRDIINFLESKLQNNTFGEKFLLQVTYPNDESIDYCVIGVKPYNSSDNMKLQNKYDLEGFKINTLLMLINLILYKDILSDNLETERNYLKRTIYKYLIFLKVFVQNDQSVKNILIENVFFDDNWEEMLRIRGTNAKYFIQDIETIEELGIV